jgi:hypothetical protein
MRFRLIQVSLYIQYIQASFSPGSVQQIMLYLLVIECIELLFMPLCKVTWPLLCLFNDVLISSDSVESIDGKS